MKKNVLENLLIVVGSISFYALFWQEKMGLNILIFNLLMLSFLFIIKPEIKQHRPTIITAIGTLITAFLVVWNNSLMTKIIHTISFISMVGFAKQQELRFIAYGFFLASISFFETPLKLAKQFTNIRGKQALRLAPVWRSFRLSVIPLIVLLLFYTIYYFSNPEFSDFSNQFWVGLLDWLSWNISFPQLLFFITGILITASIILKSDFPVFKDFQKGHKEQLSRLRKKYPTLSRGMIALKSEFQSGLILLFSLNALLLVVNILDIKNYWFGTSYQLPPLEMKAMVHLGTYLLIAALLMAMIVISYFFRKNLNFYPSNNKLKIAGYIWVAQNAILAISLFIKNYRYIEANDLAYKRIGVLIFLFLVFAGLLTMILKIRDRKTFYFLLHRNAWITYAVFIACSFVNWDVFITKYNLANQTRSEIDYSFLINDVSDKNLYLLLDQEQQNLLPEQRRQAIGYSLKGKKETFLRKQKGTSWLSWNYPDYQNIKYLEDVK